MANKFTLHVSDSMKNGLRAALKAKGHETVADSIAEAHPSEVGPEYIVGTGGGCEAYMVDLNCGGTNYLVVWTCNDGAEPATETNFRAGVFRGESMTEALLAMMTSELTLDNAPIGTKAPAISGGSWTRTELGWKWCHGATFPRPGGDWTGTLIPPAEHSHG